MLFVGSKVQAVKEAADLRKPTLNPHQQHMSWVRKTPSGPLNAIDARGPIPS